MIDYPLYFYVPAEVSARGLPQRMNDDWGRFGDHHSLVHMIRVALHEAGVPCITTSEPPENGVVIAHSAAIGTKREFSENIYLVCWQIDWPRRNWAQAHIVANHYQTSGADLTPPEKLSLPGPLFYLPFIPEPSLIPRDQSRGDLFENVAYLGTPYNLLPELQTAEWLRRVRDLGLRFSIVANPSEHGNYSNIDCLVAVRPENRSPKQKPPNKLWNAWRAGVPAVLGKEPGFQEQRNNTLDYIEASDANSVFDALRRLAEDPKLRTAMIDNGHRREADCSVTKIVNRWRDFVEGDLSRAYHDWRKMSAARRQFFFAVRGMRGTLQQIRHGRNWS